MKLKDSNMGRGKTTTTTANTTKMERADTCYDCKFGHIARYAGDPLISECQAGEGKMCASTRACGKSEKRHGEPQIEDRPKKYWFER